MIDQVLGSGLRQGQSYYFQLIPISLTIVNKDCLLPPRDTTYRFSVLKGSQKFDENRIPIAAEFAQVNGVYALPITSCRLNFYVPSVIKGRKIEFNLRLVQREGNQDYELGDFPIDAAELVQAFKAQNVSRHELKTNFSEDYELDFQIYVDTNRVALEKNIRDKKTDRAIKSPLRQRKEGDSQPASSRKNLTQEPEPEEKPSREKSKPVAQPKRESQKQTAKEPEPQQVPEPQAQPVAETVEEPAAEVVRGEPESRVPVKQSSEKAFKKAEIGSMKSKQSKPHVPLVQTKFRPIEDKASEIVMTSSQRLTETHIETVIHSPGQSGQQKLFIWLFLLVGGLLCYWAMTPSRKV